MRSGTQPSSGAASGRCRAHTVLFASVLVAGTLVTLSQRGDALSRSGRHTIAQAATVTAPHGKAMAATGVQDPRDSQPVRLPDAAAKGGEGSGRVTAADVADGTSADSGHAAAKSRQQAATGRQPSSIAAAAGEVNERQTAASAQDAAPETAAGPAGIVAAGSSGASTSHEASKSTESSSTDSIGDATAVSAAPAGDDLVNATSDAGAAGPSAHMEAAAGPGGNCQCPLMETEADTAAAQLYGRNYFAICLSIKDQHADIREWVAHHAAVGAGRLYIYDTGSSPPLNETLQDHIASGLVRYIWWQADFGTGTGKQRKFPQEDIYRHCLHHFRSRHQFIGFIDSDEFLIPKNEPGSVPALLRRMMAFEPFGALAVNWVVFGSSGHKERPLQGVLQAYTKCHQQEDNPHASHVKSIVNTQFVLDKQGPHHFNYTDGKYAVNEHFQRVDGPRYEPATVDKIALHHYVLKSEQEFREKMQRGSAMGNHKPFEFFTGIDQSADLNCTDAVGWGPYR